MTEKKTADRSRLASAALAVLFAALLGGFAAYRAEAVRTEARARSAGRIAETEAAAALLGESARGGDDLTAYHRAMTAADCAARAGDTPAAETFAALAETIRRRGAEGAPVRETVEAYFRGEIPDPLRERDTEADPIPESVLPAGAVKKAEARAGELIGERTPITRETVRAGDRLLYSASNAYVIIDPRTGEPLEFSLSLAPGKNTLDARACADAAVWFLREMCPSALPDDPTPTVAFPEQGFALVRLPGTSVRVRRDTGRIVGLVREAQPVQREEGGTQPKAA